MAVKNVVKYLNEFCDEEDIVAVAAIKAMMKFMKEDSGGISTMTEMREALMEALDEMASAKKSVFSVRSGCELFVRFITYTSLDFSPDFEECR